MSLRNATIAVAGCSSGIGQAVVKQLADMGAFLSLADTAEDTITAQAAEIEAVGGRCIASRTDIRSTEDVDAWIRRTVDELGGLDAAVNCAGIYRKEPLAAPVTEKTDEEWNSILDTNLSGTFRCLRAQLRSIKPNGSIVNLASTAGLMGCPYDAPYGVSKHGVSKLFHNPSSHQFCFVHSLFYRRRLFSQFNSMVSFPNPTPGLTTLQIIGLTRSAAREVSSRGVRINAVAPGVIDTPMLGQADKSREQLMKEIAGHTPLGRMGTAEEVARTIVFLLGDGSFTTGAVWTVDGGMSG
ncbi:hypothetical protein P7C71_g6364, partial [Lecanoromycetidae sp. Uapishka_2]